MKKILTAILALALCGAMSLTAFAADTQITPDSDPKEGKTEITFSVEPTYTVTIPSTVELKKDETGSEVTYTADLTISASDVRLYEGYEIQVTLTSDFTLAAGDATLGYTVTVGGEQIENGGVVATFGTSTTAQTSTLHFAAADPQYAGEYTDTVTFNISTETTVGVVVDPDWGDEEIVGF